MPQVFLLILIPAALAMSALFVAWPFILGVTVLIAGGNVWQGYEWSKTTRSIDPVFQQLIIQKSRRNYAARSGFDCQSFWICNPIGISLLELVNLVLVVGETPEGTPVLLFLSLIALSAEFLTIVSWRHQRRQLCQRQTPVVAFVPTPSTPEVLLPSEATPPVH